MEIEQNKKKKLRVVFPFVEAGYGHIMPMRSISETFCKKYGDRVEVILSDFYTETNDDHMMRYEQNISRQVRLYNRHPAIGYLVSFACAASGPIASSYVSVRGIAPVAYRRALAHLSDLQPDVVFSTHWATNYYAEHLPQKPLTVMYCPDAQFTNSFKYPSDFYMISMPKGYSKAIGKKPFDKNNLKLVNFLIRNEAFSIHPDQRAARRKLGLPEENFTVLLAEGGYGIGKMEKICRRLVKEHIPLTVIPVCGKNKKLYRRFSSLDVSEEVTFRPHGFVDDIFTLYAAADLFCGKSGNIIAEPTFFGIPSIVTGCTQTIEYRIADHYINTVGCAIKQFSPKKTAEMIKEFAADPSLLSPYKKAAAAYHENFGSEQAADELFKAIVHAFPDLDG